MIKKIALFLFLSLTQQTLCQASSLSEGKFHFLAGGAHVTQGDGQLIGMSNSFGNIHTVGKGSDNVFIAGLGYFLKPYADKPMDVSLGFSAYYINNAKMNGLVYLERSFPNLSYQYETVNIPFYASAKALWTQSKLPFSVVTDAGIGLNLLTTKNYRETSLDNGVTIPNQAFSGHTAVKFSAMGGVGFRFHKAFKNNDIEIGYRYFYLNRGKLKPRPPFLRELSTDVVDAHALTLTLIAD